MVDSDPEDAPAAVPAPVIITRKTYEPDSGCESGETSPVPPVELVPIKSMSIIKPAEKPTEKPADKQWSSLMVRMKPDAPKGSLKRKPAAPVKKVAPLVSASSAAPVKKVAPPASAPARPYSSSSEAPRRAWLPREEWLAQRKRESQPEDGFDIQAHGYWRTKNGLVYRCPNGLEFSATGVDSFWPRG